MADTKRGRRRRTTPEKRDQVAEFERRASRALVEMTREEAAEAVARAQAEVMDAERALARVDLEREAHRAQVDAHRQLQARLAAAAAELDEERAAHRDTQARLERAGEELNQQRVASQARLNAGGGELDRERAAHCLTQARLAKAVEELNQLRVPSQARLNEAVRELDTERAAHCLTQARLDVMETQSELARAMATALERELDQERNAHTLTQARSDSAEVLREAAQARATELGRELDRIRESRLPPAPGSPLHDFIARKRATLGSRMGETGSRPVTPASGSADWTSIPEEVEPWAFLTRSCGRLARAGIGRGDALSLPLGSLIEWIGQSAAADVLYWRRVVAGEVPTSSLAVHRKIGYHEKLALVDRLGGLANEHLASLCARTGNDARVEDACPIYLAQLELAATSYFEVDLVYDSSSITKIISSFQFGLESPTLGIWLPNTGDLIFPPFSLNLHISATVTGASDIFGENGEYDVLYQIPGYVFGNLNSGALTLSADGDDVLGTFSISASFVDD